MAANSTHGISVVIPCYNASDTLRVQLDALTRQRCPIPFEVILSDNGSTDDSAAIARGYGDRLPITVIDSAGVQGPAHATNCGVAAASYDYLAFCDADDEVSDTWLAAAVAALDEHPFVAGRVDVTRLNPARIARSRCMAQQEGLQESGTGIDLKHAGAGNMLIRRDVFEAVGGFDAELYALQDADFCWRVQLTGTPLTYDRNLLVHTRLRSTLCGMMRQAYHYGHAFALLEARYGVATQGEREIVDPRSGAHVPALGAGVVRRRVQRFAQAGLGGSAWQLAWHFGHRMGRRSVVPGPSSRPAGESRVGHEAEVGHEPEVEIGVRALGLDVAAPATAGTR